MLIIKLPFSSFWTVRHSFLQVVGIEIFICSTTVFLCMSCAALQSISRDMIFNNLKWSLMIFILSVMSSSCWARRNQAVKKLVKYIRKLHIVLNNPTKVRCCTPERGSACLPGRAMGGVQIICYQSWVFFHKI